MTPFRETTERPQKFISMCLFNQLRDLRDVRDLFPLWGFLCVALLSFFSLFIDLDLSGLSSLSELMLKPFSTERPTRDLRDLLEVP